MDLAPIWLVQANVVRGIDRISKANYAYKRHFLGRQLCRASVAVLSVCKCLGDLHFPQVVDAEVIQTPGSWIKENAQDPGNAAVHQYRISTGREGVLGRLVVKVH